MFRHTFYLIHFDSTQSDPMQNKIARYTNTSSKMTKIPKYTQESVLQLHMYYRIYFLPFKGRHSGFYRFFFCFKSDF